MIVHKFAHVGAAAFRRLCVETLIDLIAESICSTAAFRRLCVETAAFGIVGVRFGAAAFRRLCVETRLEKQAASGCDQPPSGGCVLKPTLYAQSRARAPQPPSGGCVLKLFKNGVNDSVFGPAAFGRLCVETCFY